MTKMTSAYANKVLRKLNDDKDFWLTKEKEGYLYVAAVDEEPVIPEYDYKEVSGNISDRVPPSHAHKSSILLAASSNPSYSIDNCSSSRIEAFFSSEGIEP